ncbi:hypothetical protein EW145_g714 [Phellinidium pouzarii]|uniref:NYN domain-containing protein n=1 Tax=Phellinidium pouzarii TaxID=167371 RepID=A0A4S4LHA8_9AGAM|nr:hypothetical protein EW145_g714 [Phellinidium pouzarii]
MTRVGIFWDFENCHPPSNMTGFSVVGKLRQAVRSLGSVSVFKAYMDVNQEARPGTAGDARKVTQQQDLQSSGVSLIHTPHNAKKEVADKILLGELACILYAFLILITPLSSEVDLMVFALDAQEPVTIVIITGDRDFTYAISVLRLRGHDIILISPPNATHHSLQYPANVVLNWRTDILEHPDPSVKLRAHFEGASVNSVSRGSVLSPLAPEVSSLCSVGASQPAAGEAGLPLECDELVTAGEGSPIVPTHAAQHASGRMVEEQTSFVSANLGPRRSQNVDIGRSRKGVPTRDGYYDSDEQTLVSSVASVADVRDNPWPIQEHSPDMEFLTLSNNAKVGYTSHDGVVDLEERDERYDWPRDDDSKAKCANPYNLDNNDFSDVASPLTDESTLVEDVFKELIEVLTDERAHGRLSTACMKVDLLLMQANPAIYYQIGVSGIKGYLELAQRANVIFFISINWDTMEGYVFLRPKQAYQGRDINSIPDVTLPAPPPWRLGMFGDPTIQPRAPTPVTSSSLANGANASSPTPPRTKPGQTRPIESHFVVLVNLLRELRSAGVLEIKRCDISPRLRQRDPQVYAQLGLTKAKGYLNKAQTSGIVILSQGGKKGKTVIVSLHPDYY